jgi:hypothetical protein
MNAKYVRSEVGGEKEIDTVNSEASIDFIKNKHILNVSYTFKYNTLNYQISYVKTIVD